MLKFEAKIKHLVSVGSENVKGGYIDLSSFIKNLPHQNGVLEKELFSINVRGNTIGSPKLKKDGKSGHNVYDGVIDTLDKIVYGASPNLMYLNNQGCLIMCKSCLPVEGKEDTYEITFTDPHHGFGNGQQSITSVFNSVHTLGKELMPETLIFAKLTVDFSSKDSVEICHNNNNSKSINNKDRVSNTFIENGIVDELAQKGFYLKCKKDSNIKSVDMNVYPNGMIDLHDATGFFNLLNAYHKETPWKTGSGIVDDELLQDVTTEIILEVQSLKIELEKWIKKNNTRILNYKPLFDEKHLGANGPLKNLFATCFKKYHQKFLTKYEFFDICFDCFESKVPSRATVKSIKSDGFAMLVMDKVKDAIIQKHQSQYIKELEKIANGSKLTLAV
jgi:hypothetical protein